MKQLKQLFIKRTGPSLAVNISIKMLISQNCFIKKIILTCLFCFSIQFTAKASEKYWDGDTANIEQLTRKERKKNEEKKRIEIKRATVKKENLICPKCNESRIFRLSRPYSGLCIYCSKNENKHLFYALIVGNLGTLVLSEFKENIGKSLKLKTVLKKELRLASDEDLVLFKAKKSISYEEDISEIGKKFITVCETCNNPCTQSTFLSETEIPKNYKFILLSNSIWDDCYSFDIAYWSTKCKSSCNPLQHTKKSNIGAYSKQSTEEILQDEIERVRYLEKKYTTDIDCKQCNKKLIKELFTWKKTTFSILRCPNFAECKQAYEVPN